MTELGLEPRQSGFRICVLNRCYASSHGAKNEVTILDVWKGEGHRSVRLNSLTPVRAAVSGP